MTEASIKALDILRDTGNFHWSVITLAALVIYIYANEVQKRNWDAVLIGLLLIAGDFAWEIINALILHFTQHAALWSAPTNTSYLILVGINIEIFLMFSVLGIIIVKFLPEDKNLKILKIPNRIFIPFVLGAIGICIELMLNKMNLLIWDNKYWGNWPHTWSLVINYMAPFFLITWGHFNLSQKQKSIILFCLIAVNTISWVVFVNILGWI